MYLCVLCLLLSNRNVAMPTCQLFLLVIGLLQNTGMVGTTTLLFFQCRTSFTTKLRLTMERTATTCILKISRWLTIVMLYDTQWDKFNNDNDASDNSNAGAHTQHIRVCRLSTTESLSLTVSYRWSGPQQQLLASCFISHQRWVSGNMVRPYTVTFGVTGVICGRLLCLTPLLCQLVKLPSFIWPKHQNDYRQSEAHSGSLGWTDLAYYCFVPLPLYDNTNDHYH